MSKKPVLQTKALRHSYGSGDTTVEVLKGINFSVKSAERVAIMGASGAGKSTLLNLLGGLDKPTSGDVILASQALSSMNSNQRAKLRNESLGFVYQFHHLMPEFSALENAAMPCLIAGMKKSDAFDSAGALLERVGLSHRLKHKPAQLSGGERQRVAIARALVMKPDCVLLDEPTGNLDSGNAMKVQELLAELSNSEKIAFVTVTHDPDLAEQMDTVYTLDAGLLKGH